MISTVWACDQCRVQTIAITAETTWISANIEMALYDGNEEGDTVPYLKNAERLHFCSVGHFILWVKAHVNKRRKVTRT